MVIIHNDTRMRYEIPANKCKAENFLVDGTCLICRPAHEIIPFYREETARTAFYLVLEALRDGYDLIDISEYPDLSYGLDHLDRY